MSKKFFRPPPTLDDDDDEEEDDDSSEEDEEAEGGVGQGSSTSKPARDGGGNEDGDDDEEEDDVEEDDDDEEEEEDDEEAAGGNGSRKRPQPSSSSNRRPSKKSRRIAASAFFDEEAEASSDDEDEDEEDDEEGGGRRRRTGTSSKKHLEDEGMDQEALELIRQQDRRRAQAGRFGERSVVDVVTEIEQRHRMMRTTAAVATSAATAAAPRRMLPPAAASRGKGGGGGASSVGGGGGGSVGDTSSVMSERVAGGGGNMVMMGGGGGGGGGDVYTAIAQQSLLPSVSDPNLWMVSCSTGKEQELVYQIMNKCVAHARMGRPLGISAAIAAQSKGRIYVESFHEPSVLEAIQNVRGILFSTLRLVPIGDMTTVLTVTPAKKPVQKNDWVRMTRGHYKGDLALVRAVKESGLKCIVQCVPRLDYALADLSPEEARIRRRTVRPPQKFFNAQEVASLGRQTLRRQRFPGLDVYCDYFEGNYYHDGYLLKEMTVGGMVKPLSEDDPPTLDELAKFQRRGRTANHSKDKDVGSGGFDDGDDGLGGGGGAADEDENEGSRLAASLLDELSELQGRVGLAGSSSFSSGGAGGGAAGLIIGDTVEVVEGDLVGMRGKIVSLDETTVKIRPLSVDLGAGMVDEVEFLASQVRKHIEVGAHVKVIDGRYANETGVVVAVEKLDGGGEAGGSVLSAADFTAIILTDVTSKEISVRISQVRESAEVASGQDKLQGYELYDLVVLSGGGSANEVGVIVRVGREDFTVLNNHGIAREVRPEELRGKRNSTSSRAVALDVSGNQMRCGDTVNVAEGPHKGKTATIKRMSRAQLFLHSQTRTEHAGIFVVRSRSCLLAGTRTQNRGGGGSANDGGVSPFSTPLSQSRGGPPVAAARGKRDDGLVGKTVRIQAGQWKGYVGTVTDSTATHVQVELHSRLKKVMVVRERVAVVGDKFGATEPMDAAAAAAMGSSVPMMMAAAATPMHVAVGGATPAIHGFGGATPMHDPDNSDEVWRPGGSIDQENVKEEGWGASPGDSPADSKLHFKDRDVDDESTVGGNGDGWGANGGSSDWGAPPPAVKKDEPAKQEAESAGTTGAGSASRASSLTGPGSRRDPRVGDLKHHHHPDLSDAAEDTPAWFMERVCVLVKGVGGGREGDAVSSGVIKEINTDKSALIELEDKTTTTARYHELSMIPPKEHDTVLVTGGNEIGLEGSLVCVDGTDAILKDANDEFKIIDFIHLVKISADS